MGGEIKSVVELALERLSARPDWELTCWKCGHRDTVPVDPSKRSYRCSECGCVTAMGVPMPPIAIVPHPDRRFVVSRVVQPTGPEAGKVFDITLERGYAAEYALELLSVCDVRLWRELSALKEAREQIARAIANPGSSPPVGGVVAVLDGDGPAGSRDGEVPREPPRPQRSAHPGGDAGDAGGGPGDGI